MSELCLLIKLIEILLLIGKSGSLKPFEELWSLLKPIEAYWSLLMPIEAYWSLLKPIEAFWSLLSLFNPIQAYCSPLIWSLLKPIVAFWSLWKPIGVWLKPVNARWRLMNPLLLKHTGDHWILLKTIGKLQQLFYWKVYHSVYFIKFEFGKILVQLWVALAKSLMKGKSL